MFPLASEIIRSLSLAWWFWTLTHQFLETKERRPLVLYFLSQAPAISTIPSHTMAGSPTARLLQVPPISPIPFHYSTVKKETVQVRFGETLKKVA
jgi:hypothetical protein